MWTGRYIRHVRYASLGEPPRRPLDAQAGPTRAAISGSLGAMLRCRRHFGLPNDLWEFNPATNQWAWMGGSNHVLVRSYSRAAWIYGTLRAPATGNIPGGRIAAATWTDNNGNLWLFGGDGFDAIDDRRSQRPVGVQPFDERNGLDGRKQHANSTMSGIYGTLGAFAAGNIPGGRGYGMSWTDNSGHFWLFGGSGVDANGNNGDLNDLWEFNPSTNQWAWMSGSNSINQNGVRLRDIGFACRRKRSWRPERASTWTDTNGNLWLFGGDGYDAYKRWLSAQRPLGVQSFNERMGVDQRQQSL